MPYLSLVPTCGPSILSHLLAFQPLKKKKKRTGLAIEQVLYGHQCKWQLPSTQKNPEYSKCSPLWTDVKQERG